MGLVNKIKGIIGVVTVQIEGFFTERFINLCKINNIKIWNIRNIVKGVIRFDIYLSDFKKLRKIAKKTKCKVVIKNKKGIYFKLFKYRKRKLLLLLISLIVVLSIIFSTFIWKIDVTGNEYISEESIISALKSSGLYIGKNKLFLNKKETVNLLRLNISDISWAGIDISGTKATVKVVEKTRLNPKDVQTSDIGDIVSSKSGVITKIVPENGTAKFKVGSYINKGDVAIEGTIYSKFIEPQKVTAKGILRINTEYEYEKEYDFLETIKEYTGKKLYTIGITLNLKENMLNYLNKSKKYDITKSSKKITIFGKELSFDIYTCVEYKEKEIKNTKEELIQESNQDIEEYLNNEILNNTKLGKLVNKVLNVSDTRNGIKVRTVYTINEEVGEFKKT